MVLLRVYFKKQIDGPPGEESNTGTQTPQCENNSKFPGYNFPFTGAELIGPESLSCHQWAAQSLAAVWRGERLVAIVTTELLKISPQLWQNNTYASITVTMFLQR